MPELPEVETIARQLRAALVGQRIGGVELLRRDVLRGDVGQFNRQLPGCKIKSVDRRAKRLILALHPNMKLYLHLGMSGRVVITTTNEPAAKHTHLRITFGRNGMEMRFIDPRRFGGIWFSSDGSPPNGRGMGEVGPEPLELSIGEFRNILQRRTQVKSLLMDQRRIAGLGNIYCCEALHRAGVHPLTPSHVLSAAQAKVLLREIKRVLEEAIAHEGSTYMDYRSTTGEPGTFQQFHRVYQREGLPCRRCKALVERMVTSGRSTFFCPNCQPMV